jgi:hypothetical protein
MSLKRGSYLHFDGENWKLAGDSKWTKRPLLVPNGMETFMGNRTLLGEEHSIFRCLNDEYAAQPSSICALPDSDDPMEVFIEYEFAEDPLEPSSKSSSKSSRTDLGKSLVFRGTNWKLVKENKWKPVIGFIPDDLGESLGEREMANKRYSIYKSPLGFIAIESDSST